MSRVAGVDGCRNGWVVVHWSETDGYRAELRTDLAPLVDDLRSGRLGTMAIDMPIGLLDQQPRDCDVEARKVLGPRRSSVFPAPVRDTLEAADYRDACERSRRCSGKALSKQAFHLIPKIIEVDRLVRPADQDRLVEAHPECGFARLNGGPLDQPKKLKAGQDQRRDLLSAHSRQLGAVVDAAIEQANGLPVIDLIDAAVLTVTARRVLAGTEHRLGDQRDRRGLLAQVVY